MDITKQAHSGDLTKVDGLLLELVGQYRDRINKPIFITCGTEGAHQGKEHSDGLAVDFVVDLREMRPLDAILTIMSYPFTGLGVYPSWKWGERENVLGFHVDIRSLKPTDMRQRRWLRVPDGEGFIDYGISETTLRMSGLL